MASRRRFVSSVAFAYIALALPRVVAQTEAPDESGANPAVGPPASAATDGARESGEPPASADAAAFATLLDELRARWPMRDDVQGAASEVAARLVEFAESRPEAAESSEARALAAEVYLLAGDRSSALRQWRSMKDAAVRPDDRARGAYLLGEYYFFLGESGAGASASQARDRALRSFEALAAAHPDSPWTAAGQRMRSFLELPAGESAPRFRAEFELDGKSAVRDADELRGKVILLIFWRSSTPGQREFQQQLSESLARVLREYPILDGQLEVLGVNLDEQRGLFDLAVSDWRLPWPQHHDARGFRGDLAGRFHVPRLPLYVVIDKDSKCRYAGSQGETFLTQASGALRAKRLDLESSGAKR